MGHFWDIVDDVSYFRDQISMEDVPKPGTQG